MTLFLITNSKKNFISSICTDPLPKFTLLLMFIIAIFQEQGCVDKLHSFHLMCIFKCEGSYMQFQVSNFVHVVLFEYCA